MKTLFKIFIGLIGLLFILYLSISPIAGWFARRAIDKQPHLQVRLTSFHVGLLRGYLKFTLERTLPETAPRPLTTRVWINPWALFQREVLIRRLSFDGVYIHLQKDQDGRTKISGLVPAPPAAEKGAEIAPALTLPPFHVSVEELDFTNTSMVFTEEPSTSTLTVDKLTFAALPQSTTKFVEARVSLATGTRVNVNGRGLIEGMTFQKPLPVVKGSSGTARIALRLNGGLDIQNGQIFISSNAFRYEFDRLSLNEGTKLMFEDARYTPTWELSFTSTDTAFGPLDSTRRKTPGDYTLRGFFSEEETLSAEGQIDPLDPRQWLSINLHLSGLHLDKFTPLAERHLGYRIESGFLDLTAKGKIAEGKMNFKNNLHFFNPRMDRLFGDEKEDLAEQLGIPLNTILISMRDKNGDIRLSLPVTGDVSDPDIGLSNIFAKATLKAARMGIGHAIKTAVPFLTVADWSYKGLKFAFKVRLDPVFFEGGQTALTESHRSYLKEVSEILTEKEEIRLRLCGVSGGPDTSGKEEDNKARLEKLAEDRGRAVRSYLTETLGVDRKRLFPCDPEIDDHEDAKPRVELKL